MAADTLGDPTVEPNPVRSRTVRRRAGAVMISSVTAAGLIASGGSAVATSSDPREHPSSVASFVPLATYDVPGDVAEIVSASADGATLVYTDSGAEQVGVVDISDPAAPTGAGTVDVGGEPTSVAVLGDLALVAVDGPDDLAVVDLASATVVARLPLGGQPDSLALDASGRWAAVAVENQRDEDLDEGRMPQGPPGFLVVVDTSGEDPAGWTTRDVDLTGLEGARFPTDPEPEFVDVRGGVAAVTLQENNAVALVDLESAAVVRSFSAGTVTHAADLDDDGDVSFTDTLIDAPREPDAISWTSDGYLVTANEGDYDVDLAPGRFAGGRGFTVFDTSGRVRFDSSDSFEVEGALRGHYPDGRSEKKGSEPEGVDAGTYGSGGAAEELLFVGSERGSYVNVYRRGPDGRPVFVQLLPTGEAPEGIVAVPQANLLAVSSEGDGTIALFAGAPPRADGGPDPAASVDLISPDVDRAFSALSGLSPAPGGKLYAVPDDAVSPSRIYTLGRGPSSGVVEASLRLTRDGEPASYDLEGVAQRAGGGWWAVSEGGEDTPNLLLSIDADGSVAEEVALPPAVSAVTGTRGLEGVSTSPDGALVYVAFQDAGSDDVIDGVRHAKIGRYDVAGGEWSFARYPLEAAPSEGVAVGLSEIASAGGSVFALVERDDQRGKDAAIKAITTVDVAGATFAPAGGDLPVLTETLARDLLAAGGATGGGGIGDEGPYTEEKPEGLARISSGPDAGRWYLVNDNDGGGRTDGRAFTALSGEAAAPATGTFAGLDPQLVGSTVIPKDAVENTQVGGLSGITYDVARELYYAISDDRGDKAPARFYTLSIDLDATARGTFGPADVQVEAVTTLTDPSGTPFAPGATDTEGIALTQRGTLVITSEGDASALVPPFVREFSLDGRQIADAPIPDTLAPTADGVSGIRNNLALESATIAPDGETFFTGTESALAQDGPVASVDVGATSRLVRYGADGRPDAQYAYPLGPIPAAPVPADAFAVNGLVELLALDETHLVSLERAFSTGVGNAVSLYGVDTSEATDVSGVQALDGSRGVEPVGKQLLLDLSTLGITLDNLEGMAPGPRLPDGRRSLVVIADDNFSDTQVNQVIVLAM